MRPSREVWFVAALTVAGAALRFATLDVQSFWLDEVVTADLVDRSLGGMLSAIPDSESTPPLYYILAWGWTKLFGDAEVGLRSFSALVGTATIPVVWAAARSLTTPRIGVVVAALAATNPLLVHYSQEARSYALLVLLGAAALLFFARLLENGGSRAALVGWALAAALALATHYYAVFLVAPQAVWLIATLRPRGPAVVATLAVGVVGGALLPVGIHQKKLDLASFIADTPFLERVARLPKQFLIAYQGPAEVVLAAVSIALAVLGVGLTARSRRGSGTPRRRDRGGARGRRDRRSRRARGGWDRLLRHAQPDPRVAAPGDRRRGGLRRSPRGRGRDRFGGRALCRFPRDRDRRRARAALPARGLARCGACARSGAGRWPRDPCHARVRSDPPRPLSRRPHRARAAGARNCHRRSPS